LEFWEVFEPEAGCFLVRFIELVWLNDLSVGCVDVVFGVFVHDRVFYADVRNGSVEEGVEEVTGTNHERVTVLVYGFVLVIEPTNATVCEVLA
jgi:hypothetical protein